MPSIRLNGDNQEIAISTTLAELIDSLGLEITTVAVERNRCIVPRGDYAGTQLADRDEIEIVTLVGGG